MSIDVITNSIQKSVASRGSFFKSAAPVALTLGVVSAALLPVAAGTLTLGVPAALATLGLGLVGGIGQNLLAALIQDLINRHKKDAPGSPVSEEALRAELEAELRRQWEAGGPAAGALRTEISQVLQATQAVEVALAAANDDVRQAMAQGFAQLSLSFGEFGWLLADMRHTLAGILVEMSAQGARQREDFELQQQQLSKLNLIIQRLAAGALLAEPSAETPDLDSEDTPPADVPCPYKGLAAFQAQDADDFFGRDDLLAEIKARLSATTFYAIVGPSGSGKSSLLRAGLLSAVYQGTLPGAWTSLLLTPGAQPMMELAARGAVAGDLAIGDMLARVQADPATLDQTWELLAGSTGPAGQLLLAVDQFEEVFTLCHDEAERRRFIDVLLRAAGRPDRRVCVVLTLRADHYGDCAAYTELAAAMRDNQVLVGPLSVHELRQVIEQPAARVGLRVQPALVDQIMADVAGEPGALPLLSHVLLETWQRRRGRTLTLSGYREAGGVSGAIAQTAQSTYTQMTPEQQAVTHDLFLRLIEPGADGAQEARRRARPDELSPNAELKPLVVSVLETLEAARLITADEGTVQVAHEALIREWPALRQWLDESREDRRVHHRLAEAAQEWNRLKREEGALYRGLPLATAAEWAAEHAGQLNPLERQFLAASQALGQHEAAQREQQRQRELEAARRLAAVEKQRAEAEQQRADAESLKSAAESKRAEAEQQRAAEQAQANTRLRGRNRVISAVGAVAAVTAIVACVLGLAAVFFWFSAYTSILNAQAQADRAERQAAVALSRQLAAQASAHTPKQFDLAALLSLEALSSADTVEANAALLAGLQADPLLLYYLPRQIAGAERVAFSPDGTTLAISVCTHQEFGTCSATEIRLWDVAGRRFIGQPLPADGIAAVALAFSPDGRHLASGGCGQLSDRLCSQGTVRLWDVTSGQLLGAPQSVLTDTIWNVAFSPDGALLAAGSRYSTMLLEGSSLQPANAPVLSGPAYGLAFGPDGLLATGGPDGKVTLWNVNARQPVGPPLGGDLLYVETLAFSPDKQTLASAGSDGLITLWNVHTGQRIGQPLAGRGGTIWSIAFGAGGQTLASASDDQTVRLWDVQSGRPIGSPLMNHTTEVMSVAFGADGKTLASASSDAVILWDTSGGPALWHTLSPKYTRGVAYSPDGKWAAWSDEDAIQLWDVRARQAAGRLVPSAGSNVWCVTFSPDSTLMASSSEDGTIQLWRVAGWSPVGQPLPGHSSQVYNVAFSPDGKLLASGDYEGKVILSSVATGLPIGPPIQANTAGVYDVAFSPDGKRLATAAGLEARLWDTASGLAVGQPLTVTPESSVSGVAFSPDGKLLATDYGDDNKLFLWNVANQQQVGVLVGPILRSGDVGVEGGLAFSPDGKTVGAALSEGGIVVWDLATRQQIGLLAVPQLDTGRDPGRSLAFSPDGKTLLAGGVVLMQWDIDPESWEARACAAVGRNLTQAEWTLYLGSMPYHQTCDQWPAGN